MARRTSSLGLGRETQGSQNQDPWGYLPPRNRSTLIRRARLPRTRPRGDRCPWAGLSGGQESLRPGAHSPARRAPENRKPGWFRHGGDWSA